jgi:hypothetical protein
MTTAPIQQYLRVFVLNFDPSSLPREKITEVLTENPLYLNWIRFLPGQFFFVSKSLVNDVTAPLHERFPTDYIFVTEVFPNTCNGWMPKEIWNFINNPSSAKGTTLLTAPPPSPLSNLELLSKLFDKK